MICQLLGLLSLVGLATGSASAAVEEVVSFVDDGRVVDKVIIVGNLALSYPAVKEIAQDFANQYVSHRTMFRLIIAPTRDGARRAVNRQLVQHLTYETAVAAIKTAGFPTGPIARVFGMSGNAVLTFRNGDSFREERLSGTKDPTHMSGSGSDFEVLHFRLTKLGPGSIKQPDYFLTIFVKQTPLVSAQATAEITRQFAQLTNASDVNVRARSDAWFLDDTEYPDVLPFIEKLTVPGLAEYLQSPSLVCSIHQQRLTCSGQRFSP